MRLSIERKSLLLIVAFTTVNAGIIGLIIAPTIRDVRATQQATYQLRLYLEERNRHAREVRATQERWPEIKTAAAQFAEHLLARGSELKLITTLENIAAKNNVAQRVTGSNFDRSAEGHLTLSLSISGDHRNALAYLAELEALPYFIAVRQLRLTSVTDPQTHLTQSVLDLDLSWYVTS